MLKYEKRNKELPENMKAPLEYLHNISEIDNLDVLKVLLVCKGQHERIVQLERHFSKNKRITTVSSAEGLLDIMASNISKGNALRILAKK